MKYLLLICVVILSANSISAQSNCPCCQEEYQQFDFWLGEWEVFDTAGRLIGWNSISYQQDSCLLQENWKSRSSTGTSYSYYDKKSGKWKQLWIDNSGGNLDLQGSFANGVMSMYGQASDSSLHRIRWTPLANGEVEQRWDVLSLDQQVLTTLFIGYYRKSESNTAKP